MNIDRRDCSQIILEYSAVEVQTNFQSYALVNKNLRRAIFEFLYEKTRVNTDLWVSNVFDFLKARKIVHPYVLSVIHDDKCLFKKLYTQYSTWLLSDFYSTFAEPLTLKSYLSSILELMKVPEGTKAVCANMTKLIQLANNLLEITTSSENTLSQEVLSELSEAAIKIINFFTDESNSNTWQKTCRARSLNKANTPWSLDCSNVDVEQSRFGKTFRLAAGSHCIQVIKYLLKDKEKASASLEYLFDIIFTDSQILDVLKVIFSTELTFSENFIAMCLGKTNNELFNLILNTDRIDITNNVMKSFLRYLWRPTLNHEMIQTIREHKKGKALDWNVLKDEEQKLLIPSNRKTLPKFPVSTRHQK